MFCTWGCITIRYSLGSWSLSLPSPISKRERRDGGGEREWLPATCFMLIPLACWLAGRSSSQLFAKLASYQADKCVFSWCVDLSWCLLAVVFWWHDNFVLCLIRIVNNLMSYDFLSFSSLPELLQKKRFIDMHTTIATSLLDNIKARRLDVYFEMEEKLMSRTTLVSYSVS